ncbi:hypothetical protein M0Q50_06565 [bacterium]|jgi:hypothetical protein|nr:hypothetical protein [bacterium]
MNRNLCKTVIDNGGKLIPLLLTAKDSNGLGLMNPSILVEQTQILLNLRNINYTLYHCEGQQLFTSRWGPLSYLHPENDMHLRTWNFMCKINPETLEINQYYKTNTSKFDNYEPLWDFVGLEDARLMRWNDKLYQSGVRRDTTINGQGRMELCEIKEIPDEELKEGESKYVEISRVRIQPPIDKDSYCEKNWMPVLDMPYHYVKWTNPTEVVKVNPKTGESTQVYVSKSHITNVPDFRGGSQVINYKDYRIALIHEVNLFKNKLQQKDGTYTHRFVIWDKDWNIIKMSDSFSLMDGEIEFSCGIAFYKEDMLITFGFQDNAAYILKIPKDIIDEIIGLKKRKFNLGLYKYDSTIIKNIETDSLINNHVIINEGDTIINFNAKIGSYEYSNLSKKPKTIISVENDKFYYDILKSNTKYNNSVICLNRQSNTETLNYIINNYNINNVDVFKISDINSYNINDLLPKNIEWFTKNVKKIIIDTYITNKNILEDLGINNFKNVNYYTYDNKNISELNNNEKLIIVIDNTLDIINDNKIKIGVKKLGVK